MGRSPRLIPPLVPSVPNADHERTAQDVILQIEADVEHQAKDNPSRRQKFYQSHYANSHRGPKIVYTSYQLCTDIEKYGKINSRRDLLSSFLDLMTLMRLLTYTQKPPIIHWTCQTHLTPFLTYYASELKPHVANSTLCFSRVAKFQNLNQCSRMKASKNTSLEEHHQFSLLWSQSPIFSEMGWLQPQT